MYRGTGVVEEYRSTVEVQGYNQYRGSTGIQAYYRGTGKVQEQSGTRIQQ